MQAACGLAQLERIEEFVENAKLTLNTLKTHSNLALTLLSYQKRLKIQIHHGLVSLSL